MKSKVVAIASAIAIAMAAAIAVAGIALAGPAAAKDTITAKDNVVFCVLHIPDESLCATSQDDRGSDVNLSRCGCQSWDVPGKSGQIMAVGDSPSECMQLGPKDYVIEEACRGRASEEWTASKGHNSGYTVFKNKSDHLCLYADAAKFTVKVATCNSSNRAEEWAQTKG